MMKENLLYLSWELNAMLRTEIFIASFSHKCVKYGDARNSSSFCDDRALVLADLSLIFYRKVASIGGLNKAQRDGSSENPSAENHRLNL